MRKLGNRKVSVQRMNKREKNAKAWRLTSLYIGMVAGITAYFSLILNFLKLIKVSDMVTNTISMIMAALVLILVFFSRNYKVIDKIHNKKLLESILDALSMVGILVFPVEKISNIIPLENQLWSDIMPLIFLVVILMVIPISVILLAVKRRDWIHNVD